MRYGRGRLRPGRLRPGHRGVTLIIIAAISAVAGATNGEPAIASPKGRPAQAECTAGWQEMHLPSSAFVSRPFDVIAHEGSPAWIVGGSGSSGLLVLERQGDKWVRKGTPSKPVAGLGGAVATGPSAMIAVGYDRPDTVDLEPLSGGVRRGRWSTRAMPHPLGDRATLTDLVVTASGKAWAVGYALSRGQMQPLVLRWDGTRWSRRRIRAGHGEAGLVAIAGPRAGLTWAVGWKQGQKGRWRTLIVRRNGSTWTTDPGAPLPAGSAVLTDVAFPQRDRAWAVGYLVPSGVSRHEPILERWNGRDWTRVPLPWADGMSAIPRSLSARPDGHVWVAGTRLATDERETRGFIAHFDPAGDSWTVRDLDIPANIPSEMLSVAATRDGAVATGSVEATALALETCRPGVASSGRRVRVSSIKARRTASARDAADEHHGDASRDGLDVPVVVSGGVTLAAPTPPDGFRVRDVAEDVGLAARSVTYGGLAADFDGDGRMDIFYSRHGRKPKLALRGPNGFHPGGEAAFSMVDRHGCAAEDIDQDGAVDIFCAVGRGRGSALNRHEVSLRPGWPDGRVARGSLGAADPSGRGRLVAFMHLDGDPWPELFIASQPDRIDALPGTNRFFRNVEGRLVAAPEVGLDHSVGGSCLWTGDADDDGDDDLILCVEFPDDGRPAGLRLYRNEGGRLRERSRAMGVRPIGDVDALLADVSGDGRPDLVQLSRRTLRVSRRTKDGFKKVSQVRVSEAIAVAAGDVSGDGRADIYVLRGGSNNRPDRLLVSQKKGGFISVRIPQVSSGGADDVVALDHDDNGLTDFLVLNGWLGPGAVQLLAAFPKA